MSNETKISQLEEEFSCPVCHEVLFEPVALKCGHLYCKMCLKYINATVCAICREPCGNTDAYNVVKPLEKMLKDVFPNEYHERLLFVDKIDEQIKIKIDEARQIVGDELFETRRKEWDEYVKSVKISKRLEELMDNADVIYSIYKYDPENFELMNILKTIPHKIDDNSDDGLVTYIKFMESADKIASIRHCLDTLSNIELIEQFEINVKKWIAWMQEHKHEYSNKRWKKFMIPDVNTANMWSNFGTTMSHSNTRERSQRIIEAHGIYIKLVNMFACVRRSSDERYFEIIDEIEILFPQLFSYTADVHEFLRGDFDWSVSSSEE
jgi:hypothetical protein